MKNYYVKKLFHFSIGPVAGAIISFITIPMTTYFVSPDEYGKANMFLLVQTLLTAYLYFGFDQAYTREYHENEDKKNLIQNAMFVPLLIASLLTVICVIFHSEIAFLIFYDRTVYLPIIILCISMFTLVFERFFLLSIRMEENAKRYSLLTFLIKVLVLLVTLLLIFAGIRDFKVIIYGSLIGQILGDIIIISCCLRFLNIKGFNIDKNLIRKLFIFGLPIFIAFSIEAVFNASDRIILNTFANYKELGIYVAALKIASLLKILQSAFTTFWIPTAYRWHKEKQNAIYFQRVSDLVTIIFSCVFLTILLGKNLLLYVFPESYKATLDIFPFLCFIPILYTISETTTLGIVFSRKTYLNIFVSISAVIVNTCLSILLVPIWGAKGAAISMGISYFIYYIIRTLLSRRHWRGVSISRQLVAIGIIFAASMLNTFSDIDAWAINGIALISIILLYAKTLKIFIFKKKVKRYDLY
ncbi:lipopolysaccharide biosynthesis protein [Listeria fleischmannii]|uniref:Oligosaccharide flippase family protein n=1 Tax=Listeria fleischmannii TaxID=1069827 RepID=A0A841YBP7_9LIST|nr:oligosaccharide flippase family protein [Listeria fleischmannii]EIA20382.1 polysaccharide biosynthesis protein [Listeria fleischmannii subsp. coloradonensis]MBC1397638.1 oligosaccharide flippase family protein [Listeria fleischmannii]MBC1426821.1 oligosaccharide flippase family protein [Listeria fleischmannii]STY33720.1 Polysaccharide biosynthesis protein [Listeria fleischmannii subsp. coloradonensis]